MSLHASICIYQTDFNEASHVVDLLQRSRVVEHISVMDNSETETPAYRDMPITYVFMNRNVGYGSAHNVAMRESINADADYHLVINCDVDFNPDDLRVMVHYMDSHPDVGILTPRFVDTHGQWQASCHLLPTPFDLIGRRFLPKAWINKRNSHYELRETGLDHIINAPYLVGAFMLIRVNALRQAGLFDERFFMYPEDIDITRRIHRHYRTLYYPDVTIMHEGAHGSYHSMHLLHVHIVNMIRYFNKWGWIIDRERVAFNRQVISETQDIT